MFLDLHRFLEQMAPCSPWLPEHDSYMYPLYHHVYWSPLVRFLQCFSAKKVVCAQSGSAIIGVLWLLGVHES